MYIHTYERAPAIKRRVVPGRVALALLTVLVVSTDVYWIVAYARDVIVAPVYKGLGVTSRARGVDAICASGTTTIARFRRVASPRSGTDDITNKQNKRHKPISRCVRSLLALQAAVLIYMKSGAIRGGLFVLSSNAVVLGARKSRFMFSVT